MIEVITNIVEVVLDALQSLVNFPFAVAADLSSAAK